VRHEPFGGRRDQHGHDADPDEPPRCLKNADFHLDSDDRLNQADSR